MPTRPATHRPHAAPAVRRAEHRPSSAKRGYGRSWREYRAGYLRRNPVCRECPAPAEHVDHIQAVAGPNDPRFWDESNHQPLCHACHSRKTARHDGGFGRARR